jgi:hypothetical protein
MTTSALVGLFLCGAALSLFSAMAGAFLALWAMHVGRAGAYPLPRFPVVRLFGKRPSGEPEENGQAERQRHRAPMGP